jgi:hypothetical protein
MTTVDTSAADPEIQPQVDDVADAESVDIGQLRLGRLGRMSLSDHRDDASCRSFQGRPWNTPT